MGSIFTSDVQTVYVEGEEDRPGVEAAWHKRMSRMSLSTVDFVPNSKPKSSDQAAYTGAVNAVLSTNWYIGLSRTALGLDKKGDKPLVFADVGCRTPADVSEIIAVIPANSRVIFHDKNQELLNKIPFEDGSVTSEGVSVDCIAAPADQLQMEDHSVDLVRCVRLMQQMPWKQMSRVSDEVKRVLKPGGRALFLDLAWKKAATGYGPLDKLMHQFMYELGNPVANPNAHEYTAEVMLNSGFVDVRQDYATIRSGIKEKFQLWSGVSRIAAELHSEGVLPAERVNKIVRTIDEAYDSEHLSVEFVMPVSYTMGRAPE